MSKICNKNTSLFSKLLFIPIIVFSLVACSSNTADAQQEPTQPKINTASYPDLGEAPELKNEIWLNTDSPLRLADLGGKVVLLDMWTFG